MDVSDFAARVPETQLEARNLVETIGYAVAAFSRKAAEVRADRRFTPAGHREKISEMAGGPKEFLRQMRENLAKDMADVRDRRAEIALPKLSYDVVDEMRRAEIRSYLRSLSKPDAVRAMLADRDIALAALDGPRQLSGLDQDLFGRVRDQVLDELHGPELLALADEEVANETIKAVLAVADQQISIEVEEPLKSQRAA